MIAIPLDQAAPEPSAFWWILGGGLAMNAIALVGSATTRLDRARLDRLLLPLVALAAGSLLGGAFFHLIPAAWDRLPALHAAAWVVGGFVTFFALEQFLHWHHCHRSEARCRERPLAVLILVGDALHNFLGGVAVAGTFLLDARAGIASWIAAAAHEVPQELGDFGVLVHSGFEPRRALRWNVLTGATFPLGALCAYGVSWHVDTAALALFGAGNFVYIAASDLVPEIKAHAEPARAAVHLWCFLGSLALLYGLALFAP